MNGRKKIKQLVSNYNIPELNASEKYAAKSFFKSRGYTLNNTDWHSYLKATNGKFYADYIPEDIFRPIISPKLNQKRQWPALLDKNLSYTLFKEFKQPNCIIQNINGFYYVKEKIVSQQIAIDSCIESNNFYIIKPSIDSGQGNSVEKIIIDKNAMSKEKEKLLNFIKTYKKDFVIQEVVKQSKTMSALNPSSLNTLRIMTYLRPEGAVLLSAVSRIGQVGSHVDNFSNGGIICGIRDDGSFKNCGYTKKGEVLSQTPAGIIFNGYKIPNYESVVQMVKQMHPKVPYFKLISWDIGLDEKDQPILIEYNTYNQSTDLHQITNGPLFGKFTDEILALALKSNYFFL